MKDYSGKDWKIYNGNMLDMLEVIKPCSIDSIVTDPPYELNFMGKGWDNSGIAFQQETWKRCYEVLKSGGYLLAFGGSRTFHRIAVAIEDAGFEIRDVIMWLYGSGFPKSMNIGLSVDKKCGIDNRTGKLAVGVNSHSDTAIEGGCFQTVYEERKASNKWDGWGTALKPSYEPIIVARKPCEGTCVDNVLKYGVGGINIDECRCGKEYEKEVNGRFPANTILTYDDTDFDEVCGGFPQTSSGIRQPNGGAILNPDRGWNNNSMVDKTVRGFEDSGSAARYFYCAKASKKDRDEGLEGFEDKVLAYSNQAQAEVKRGNTDDGERKGMNRPVTRKNTHPTVKPTSLMQYLVRLVTPKCGTVLDPFNGSGSTGKAVMYENKERNSGYKYIGIELTDEYIPISVARIKYAADELDDAESVEKNTPVAEKEIVDREQMTIFDFI